MWLGRRLLRCNADIVDVRVFSDDRCVTLIDRTNKYVGLASCAYWHHAVNRALLVPGVYVNLRRVGMTGVTDSRTSRSWMEVPMNADQNANGGKSCQGNAQSDHA